MVKRIIQSGIDRGKNLIGGKQESIISAAFVMMVLLALTKIAGFAKIHFFARIFGASRELDVFWAAFTVPDIIFNVVVLGSVNAALVPSFAESLGKNGMGKMFSEVVRLFLFIFIVLSSIVFVFAPQLAKLVAYGGLGGFGFESGDFTANDVELMALLMRIMVISPIVLGTSSILTAALQVHKRFFIPALAPLMYNIGIIIGALVFASGMNMGVVGLALGVVLGTGLHILVQIPLIKNLGLGVAWRGALFTKDVMKVVRLALPRVFGLIGEQISILVNTFISMGLGAGALSAFRFGSSLYLMPVQLVGTTVAQAALPTLSLEYSASERPTLLDTGKSSRDLSGFARTFTKTLQQILYLILPAAVFFVVLRLPIVRLVLGAGAFDWEDTVMTAWVLALFGLAMLMHAIVALVVRAFFAMHETKIPVIISFISLAVNIAGAIFLTNFFSHYYDWRPVVEAFLDGTKSFGSEFGTDIGRWFTTRNSSPSAVGGLALSAGLALLVEAIALMWILNKRVPVLSWKKFWQPSLRKFFAAFIMFFGMYSVYTWWNFSLDTSTVVSIISLFFFVGGIGVLLYLAVSIVIDIPEVKFFTRMIRRAVARVNKVMVNGTNNKNAASTGAVS